VTNITTNSARADDTMPIPGLPAAVPVTGGTLTVQRFLPLGEQPELVVLAIHGITSNGMIWRPVARDLMQIAPASVLAPDLRGRGGNAGLPGPYGIAAHVSDMVSVLDTVGAERAILVGHSMGAYVAARLAAEHPERTAGVVLVDGGTHVSRLNEEAAAAVQGFLVGPALVRHAMPFVSVQAYLDFWRLHPAFTDAWNDDVEAFVLHDLTGRPGGFRYVINVEAIETDSDNMLTCAADHDWVDEIQAPLRLLRARYGAMGEKQPLIEQRQLDEFSAGHPEADVEDVCDVNHYTILLGEGPGSSRVAAAIAAVAQRAASA
jgi:pimeloyl-ACP methyl ester carboxylesterase